MNVFTIAGNIGRDAELRQVQGRDGSISVANFAVAVNKRQQGETLWVDCALWGKRADALVQYLTKGSKVTVTGEADLETFDGRNGPGAKITLRVQDIALQGAQQGQQAAPAQQQQKAQNKPYQRPVERYGSAAPNPMANEPAQQQMPNDFDPDSDIPFAPIGLQEGRNFLHMI